MKNTSSPVFPRIIIILAALTVFSCLLMQQLAFAKASFGRESTDEPLVSQDTRERLNQIERRRQELHEKGYAHAQEGAASPHTIKAHKD